MGDMSWIQYFRGLIYLSLWIKHLVRHDHRVISYTYNSVPNGRRGYCAKYVHTANPVGMGWAATYIPEL